jgi:hypothetical protein
MKRHMSKNVDAEEKRFEQSDDEGASAEPVCLLVRLTCLALMHAVSRLLLHQSPTSA